MRGKVERSFWSSEDLPGLELSENKIRGVRSIPPHRHRWDAVTIVYEGRQSVVEQYQGQSFRLTEGSVAVLPRGVVLSGEAAGHCLTIAVHPAWGLFRGDDLVKTKLAKLSNKLLLQTEISQRELWSEALHKLQDTDPVSVRTRNEAFPADAERTLRGIFRRLESEFSEKLTLEELASPVGWHPHYLQKMFRRRFGISPARYQSQLRAELAFNLVREGYSGTEIAHKLGYSDQSHLIRAFRLYHGVSPSRASLKSSMSRISNLHSGPDARI